VSELSPDAQAILHGFWDAPVSPSRNVQIAAALCAAADRIVPEEPAPPPLPPMHEMIEDPRDTLAHGIALDQRQATRAALLDLAAELRGSSD
jgi:hypothetical protein